jgi:uncharacterized protein YjiK
MERFGPSVIALLAGIAWLGITTTLIPASEGERVLPVAKATTLEGPCSTAMMVARLPEVHEASGLAISRRHDDLLWTHNDSGQPVLYALDTDGKLRGRVRVAGAEVDDWEDIASGPCPEGECLYLADIGDNRDAQPAITIHRVPEPAPDDKATSPVVAFHATYPEGPQDAEGFFLGPNGEMYVVSKGEGSPIRIYRFLASTPGGTTRLERVVTLAAAEVEKDRRLTDAEATADGKWIVLRTLEAVTFHRAEALLAGEVDKGIEVDVKKLGEPQGEGVALSNDGTLYLAGEAADGVGGGTLARVSCKLP